MRTTRLLGAAVALLAALPGQELAAAPRAGKLSLSACTRVDAAALARLPDAFEPYREFTCRYPVPGSAGAISIVAVQVNKYYTSQPSVPDEQHIPLPLVISRDFAVLGSLPLHYPDDGPITTAVTFGPIRAGVPQEIRIRADTIAAGPAPSSRRLRWDAGTQTFKLERAVNGR